jgi:hypothetical protein
MRGLTIATIVVAGLSLTAGGVMLTARGQQSRPGEIGENHVLVDNRYPNQAVPVVVQQNLDPAKALGVRAVRQPWEYRTLTLAAGKDPARFLSEAGLDGWEAVGVQSGPSGTTVLLKRPR